MGHQLRRVAVLGSAFAVLVAASLDASSASAQSGPDLREIRPDIILLVDNSASMDYAMSSVSGAGGQMPVCTGSAASTSTRSRWISLVEALTGTYSSGYYCAARDRRTAYVGAPDQYAPHTYAEAHGLQGNDGILDTYLDRVRFGLMTFDNIYGLNLTPPPAPYGSEIQFMVDQGYWSGQSAAIRAAPGDYSYGNAYALRFPGCTTTYMVNGGARRAIAGAETPTSFGGSLVSVGPASIDVHVTNAQIQTALLAARPFGSTPTGAMLDDLRYYLTTDPDATPIGSGSGAGDPYQACRHRYAILITDGESSDPFRNSLHCDTGSTSACPYDRPANIAGDLCRYSGSACTGLLDGVFVVAYATASSTSCTTNADCAPLTQTCSASHVCVNTIACTLDAQCGTSGACVGGFCSSASPELNAIAHAGGTNAAILALDSGTLRSALQTAIDQAQPGTTTRTGPAFSLSAGSYAAGTLGSASAPQEQLQVGSGFLVSDPVTGAPWRGVLDRTRFVCDASLTPVQQPLAANDHFADVLNARNLTSLPRRLYTVAVPVANESGIITYAVPSGLTIPHQSYNVPFVNGQVLSLFETTNAAITPQSFGLLASDLTTRTAIFDYVHGRAPANRAAARLGDIYHSTPAIVTAPRVDIDDQAYALFRQRPEVSGRPSIVYVGTNDGVLHAFSLEDDPSGMLRWSAGQELWGFVPPTLMPNALNSGRTAHQFMVDGTPVVRDVVLRRAPGDSAASDMYHSVLIVGLRGGGNAYLALDVTDPTAPTFLWQWTNEEMGLTYGRPGLGQVLVDTGGGIQQRAIAVLPGGAGTIDSTAAIAAGTAGCASMSGSRPTPLPDGITTTRTGRRCWRGTAGRSIHVVDVATGEVIRSFQSSSGISSPITGGVSLFSGDIGQMATRAFVTDADGILWRLDMSHPSPSQWTFTPLHDLYWADTGTSGQPVYDPPIVSVEANGDPVIVVGGGDQDNLEGSAPTRVVSITEMVDHTQTPSPSTAKINWEIRLQPGEQVTGPMVLFSNYVYFGSFWSAPDPADACSYGQSRIWGVHYLNTGGPAPLPYTTGVSGRFPAAGLVGTSGTVDTYFVNQAAGDGIVFGVGVTQRPNCTTGAGVTDQYLGQRYQISNLQPGQFQLVAQISGRTSVSVPSTASTVQTVTIQSLPPPAAMSRALSYMPAADF